jgi:hypothetical protein
MGKAVYKKGYIHIRRILPCSGIYWYSDVHKPWMVGVLASPTYDAEPAINSQ